jgi:hypothetical protein
MDATAIEVPVRAGVVMGPVNGTPTVHVHVRMLDKPFSNREQ